MSQYQKVFRSVEYVQRRFADALNSIDSRFTIRDVEQLMQRDGYLSHVERFVTDGSVTCLYCLVAEDPAAAAATIDGSPANLRGGGGSTSVTPTPAAASLLPQPSEDFTSPTAVMGGLYPGLYDYVMFVTRIANVTGVSRIVYALRLPSSSSADPASFSVDDIMFGSVQTDSVAQELGDMARNVFLPVQLSSNESYVDRANAQLYLAMHPAVSGGSNADEEPTGNNRPPPSAAAAMQNSHAMQSSVRHQLAPIPGGYSHHKAVQDTDHTVRSAVRNISSGLDSIDLLTKESSLRHKLPVSVDDTATVLCRVHSSPHAIARAAADPGIATECEALVARWVHGLRTLCSKDGMCGFGATVGLVPSSTGGGGGHSSSNNTSQQHTGGAGRDGGQQQQQPLHLQPRRPPQGAPHLKLHHKQSTADMSIAQASTRSSSFPPQGAAPVDVKLLLTPPAECVTYNFQLVPEAFGPLAELSQWKDVDVVIRTQLETLQEPEIAAVIQIVTLAARRSTAAAWESAIDTLKARADEARGCIKYLTTIERHIQPIYATDLLAAKAAIPGLVKNIATLQRVVPYYAVNHHLQLMLQSISHQIVTCSKLAIRRPGRLWEQTDSPKQIQQTIDIFVNAIALSRSFQEELAKEPALREDLDELAVFGRLELFCSRLVKLSNLFSTTLVFRNLELYSLDGVDSILSSFFASLDDLRRKSGDSLDYTKPSFDSDFVEFKHKVGDVDCSLQVLVNSCFENVPNVTSALDLLHKFNVLVLRPSLRADLQAKYFALFQRYGLELEAVQRVYELHKADPPLARNSPPVAGRIAWARQLLPRIEGPMKVFQASQALVSHQRDTTKIIRLYNRIALALTEYEAFWTAAWVKAVPMSIDGIRATLLVRSDDGYLVNFDAAIVELIREAKWLHRMGVELPAAAMELVRLRNLLPLVNQLQYTMDWAQRTIDRISPKHLAALQPLIQQLEKVLAPGLTTITWNSASVVPFIANVTKAGAVLEATVDRINAIVEKRINPALQATSEMLCVPVASPSGEPFTVQELLAAQEQCAERAAATFGVANATIREGITDFCRLIDPTWSPGDECDPNNEPTTARTELLSLYQYYNRYFFRTVLMSVTSSLMHLKRSMGMLMEQSFILCAPQFAPGTAAAASSSSASVAKGSSGAFLRLTVDLAVPHVVVIPQVEEIQKSLNRCVQLVLNCTASVGNWPGTHSAYSSFPTTFIEEISKNKDTVKTVLQLGGTVLGVHQYVDDYLRTLHRFQALWVRDPRTVVAGFAQSARPQLHVEEELMCCDQLMAQITLIQDSSFVGCFQLDCLPLKKALGGLCLRWKEAYASVLHTSIDDKLNALLDKTEFYLKRTSQPPPVDFSGVQDELTILDGIASFELHTESVLLELQTSCTVLEKFSMGNTGELQDRMLVIRNKWRKLHIDAQQKRDAMARIQHIYKKDVTDATNRFGIEMLCFRTDFELNGPLVEGIAPSDAIDRLKKFQRVLQDKMRRWQTNTAAQALLGCPVSVFPELAKTAREVYNAAQLYNLYQAVNAAVSEAKRTLWCDVRYDRLVLQCNRFLEDIKRLPPSMRAFAAHDEMKLELQAIVELQPLVEQLSHHSIRPRHWEHIMKLCGSQWDLDSAVFRLESVLGANLIPNIEEIMDLAVASEKEADLEHRLTEIKHEWKERTMTFAAYKHRGLVMLKPEETSIMKEQLDDTLVMLGSLVASKYVAPFRTEATLWCSRLTLVGETLNSFLEVQGLWMYLEAVFSTGDIMKQLPAEAKRFSIVDKQWIKIFAKAREMPNVLDFGNGSESKTLGYLRDQLELCQRSLATYLEQKRNAFARFYFVSDAILLEILAQGSDPNVMQSHFATMFDGLCNVMLELAEDKRSWRITAVRSAEMEVVQLSEAIPCEGLIEAWLARLCNEMRRTIRLGLREGISDALSVRSDPNQLKLFLFRHPAQVVLTALQIQFTSFITEVLNGKPNDRKDVARRLQESKDLLSEQARADLSAFQRTHIQTLITMAVHNLEIWEETVKRAKDPNAFEWQRQVRFYFTERNDCILSIADATLDYAYEYLGIKERLVVTPLTDRCYTTLSQALAMHMGGAPVGPAGTGKTETVKDLGRAAGKYIVVFNCGEQWDVRAMGKIFRGLAQAGCWGCFDEFNRISLSVLSVVSQQLHTIFTAHKTKKTDFVFTDGQTCGLKKGLGVFVTMNPDYAGRQDLPQNLKSMFRSVSMMAPDRMSIVKTKLAASGYKLDKSLAKKFCLMYDLCAQQLSRQQHYDFGLRNILSVLRAAGELLRQSVHKDEELVFMRCLRDMNLSKLVHGDVPVFQSLLADVFPASVAAAQFAVESELLGKMRQAATDLGFQPSKGWLAKCYQLYETKLVRHGVMIVGPAGGGKTTCIATLLKFLSQCERRHKEVRMNPKAITADQMFGVLDATTGDWTDGIFSSLWRSLNRERAASVWLICDGPIDTSWVESLNTVLDDNKLLTLANGDRIAMAPTLKLCMEADDLRNASPATVSRAGIVFLSSDLVGWEAVMGHKTAQAVQLTHWTQPVADVFLRLGRKLLGPLIAFIETNCKSSLGTPGGILACRVVEVAYSMIKFLCQQSQKGIPVGTAAAAGSSTATAAAATAGVDEALITKAFWYAAAWGLCGELSAPDRQRFAEFVDSDVPGLQVGAPIFEQFVDFEQGAWGLWKSRVPLAAIKWDPALPYVSAAGVFVPSLDSTVLHALLAMHLDKGQPVLLFGESGCAKTVTIQKLLRDTTTDTQNWKKTNVSRNTTQTALQRSIEDLCEKRMGSVYGPQRNRRLSFFVDDMNMAATNEWGDQEACELLRQLLEHRGVYSLDRIGEWKRFVDIKFVAAATIQRSTGGGGSDGSASCSPSLPNPTRLMRHFSVYKVSDPSEPTLALILSSILQARFDTHLQFVALIQPIVQASLTVWRGCAEKLVPTPSRSHYSFSLRDLMGIAQGMLMADVSLIETPMQLLSLWAHECSRAIGDKLSVEEDCVWFTHQMAHACHQKFAHITSQSHAPPIGNGGCYANFVHIEEASLDDSVILQDPTMAGGTTKPRKYQAALDAEGLRNAIEKKLDAAREMPRGATRSMSMPPLDLVLYASAVQHICRISRVLATPNASMLLVGVGGSGKQTTARVAALLQDMPLAQPVVTAGYTLLNFMDDLRSQFFVAGVQGPTVMLISDNEIREDAFLDLVNSALASADVAGLFDEEEKEAVRNAIRPVAKRQARRHFEDSDEWLWGYFVNRVRSNLHFVLSMSPQHERFYSRVRQFPSIMGSCTIDFFFPWATSALVQVCQARLMKKLSIAAATPQVLETLPVVLAHIHTRVQSLCVEYRSQGTVHATPELFLRLLPTYRKVYGAKEAELRKTYNTLVTGLEKLQQAGADVQKMRIDLDVIEKALLVASKQVSDLLFVISAQAEQATEKKMQVQVVTEKIASEAAVIAAAREEAELDLVAAQPALVAARQALDQITSNDINTLRAMRRPPKMIRRIFDGVCILLHERMGDVGMEMAGATPLLVDSWVISGRLVCSRPNLLDTLNAFNVSGKDRVNDETCELLLPYISQDDFTFERAKVASGNIAGLCTWVRAMVTYRNVSKYVAPKIEKLALSEYKLRVANEKLSEQKQELAKAEAVMAECVARLNDVKGEKMRLENDTLRTRRRLTYSTELIAALGDERRRWEMDERQFSQVLERLVGDTAAAAAFITYAGPFNADFRRYFQSAIVQVIQEQRLPFSGRAFHFTRFMVPEQRVTEWQLQALPMDDHSVQNAIIATQTLKPPLFTDTESQMFEFIQQYFMNRANSSAPSAEEVTAGSSSPTKTDRRPSILSTDDLGAASGLGKPPIFTKLSHPSFPHQLEAQLLAGGALVVEDTAFGVSPVLESLLQFRFVRMTAEGRQVQGVSILGVPYEYNPGFTLWMQTKAGHRLAPETFAAVTVIDASVTHIGLHQQLLSKVVMAEKKDLEHHRQSIREELFANESKLRQLEVELLEKLSSAEGSLVDDESLILTLQHSKLSAEELKMKLAAATDTQARIALAREEYAPVAERGQLLYFVAKELSKVSYSYQLSLSRLLRLFQQSLLDSAPAINVHTRIRNIADTFTQLVFASVGRGLLEVHKPLLGLLLAMRILIARKTISQADFCAFLIAGTAIDMEELAKGRPKPAAWMLNHTWKHVASLTALPRFANIRDAVAHADGGFKTWIESETPELLPMPYYTELSPYERLMAVRCFREDRVLPAVSVFIRDVLGAHYTEVPHFDLGELVAVEAVRESRTPILFLLTPGSDPTQLIEAVAKKKRRHVALLSLGQGQEPAAIALLNHCAAAGEWAVFQNCHLSPAFLKHLEGWSAQHHATASVTSSASSGGAAAAASPASAAGVGGGPGALQAPPLSPPAAAAPLPSPLAPTSPGAAASSTPFPTAGGAAVHHHGSKDHADFRVFLGCEPGDGIPLPLLQRSLVLTDEPPAGTSATIRSVVQLVPQDTFDVSHRSDWRASVYALCFYHATLLERRKYGAKGWTAPYQFSDGDFLSSLAFLASHFSTLTDERPQGAGRNPPGGSSAAQGGNVTLTAVSWEAIRYMVGEIHYGGRITRSNDRRTIEAITEQTFSAALSDAKTAVMCPELGKFPVLTEPLDIILWRQAVVGQFSANEPPTVFGLTANAELSHRTVQAQQALALLLSVQPQGVVAAAAPSGGAGGTPSQDVTLVAMLMQLTKKLPPVLEHKAPPPLLPGPSQAQQAHRQLLERLDPVRPMGILFAHELSAVNRVASQLATDVANLLLALKGLIRMTPDLDAIAKAVYVSQVPAAWEALSWSALSFGLWMNMLHRRHEQVRVFFIGGERTCYDFGAFFNPRGLLSVTRQEICRKRSGGQETSSWLLERVETKFTITRLRANDVERSPEEGVFISGLLLDGASWDIQRGRLRAPLPLELFHELPVVHVSAALVAAAPGAAPANGMPGGRSTGGGAAPLQPDASMAVELQATTGFVSQQQFRNFRAARETEPNAKKVRLPCFSTPRRLEDQFISTIELLHDEAVSSSWVIRGVALLTSAE